MPPHVHTKFRGPPSWLWRKCNRLLRLGHPWGAVTLSRWSERWYIGRWGARRGLKSRSTNYPYHGHHGDPPPIRKMPMVEPGIEPGTSCLVVRSSDRLTTRLVSVHAIKACNGNGGTSPIILNPRNRWRSAVNLTAHSFTSRPPPPPLEKGRCTHWIRGCVGQDPVWTFWRRDESLGPAGIWTPDRQTRSPAMGMRMMLPNGMRSVNNRRVCLAYIPENKSHSHRCHAVKCKSLLMLWGFLIQNKVF